MKNVVLFLCLFFSGILSAQDIHWSQFYDNPLFLNPANAGNFRGTERFHVQYRDQWRSVTKAFQTFSFSFDTRLKKHTDFGMGFLLLSDVVGDGKFKTLELQLTPSYRKNLEKDSSRVLSFGLDVGMNQRNFTFPNFYFDEQYNGTTYDKNLPITESKITDRRTNLTIGTGITYLHRFDRKKNIQFGLSAFNLNQPNQGFYGEKVKRDIRLCFYVLSEIKLKDKFHLLPSVILQRQGTYTEFIFGTRIKYLMQSAENGRDEKTKKSLYAGLFFRTRDAFFLNLGLDYNKWYVAFNYDINTSTLVPASGKRGGFEIVTKYTMNRFKPKKIQHRICPEFI